MYQNGMRRGGSVTADKDGGSGTAEPVIDALLRVADLRVLGPRPSGLVLSPCILFLGLTTRTFEKVFPLMMVNVIFI